MSAAAPTPAPPGGSGGGDGGFDPELDEVAMLGVVRWRREGRTSACSLVGERTSTQSRPCSACRSTHPL
eukprot:366212-Chlamydomonas_euryale.AAC.44